MSTDDPQTVTQRYPGLGLFVAIVLASGVLAAVLYYALRPTAPAPLLSGTAESGTFWKYPMTAASNEGSTVKGHRIEVYESVVVATDPETGRKHVRPHGFYSELVVK